MNRRGFLRGVVGSAAVTLAAEASGGMFEVGKKLVLPVVPKIVTDLDDLTPPFGIVGWEIVENGSYRVRWADKDRPRTLEDLLAGMKVARVHLEIIDRFERLDVLQQKFEDISNNGSVTWKLPHTTNSLEPSFIVHGRISAINLYQNVGDVVRGSVDIICVRPASLPEGKSAYINWA